MAFFNAVRGWRVRKYRPESRHTRCWQKSFYTSAEKIAHIMFVYSLPENSMSITYLVALNRRFWIECDSNHAIPRSLQVDRMRFGWRFWIDFPWFYFTAIRPFLLLLAAEFPAIPGPRLWESCDSRFTCHSEDHGVMSVTCKNALGIFRSAFQMEFTIQSRNITNDNRGQIIITKQTFCQTNVMVQLAL